MEDEGLERPRHRMVTRQELFAEVWKHPLSELSKEYGISDRGLSKICRRLDIPVPPQGHWNQVGSADNIRMPELPARGDGIPSHYFLKPKNNSAKPTRSVDDLLTIAGKQNMPSTRLSIPDKLVKPHSLVAGWISARRLARQQARENRSEWAFHVDPGPFTENERRRHRIMSALFKAIEREGGLIEESAKGQLFICEERDRLEISLRERMTRVRIRLTDQQRSWRPYSNETHKWALEHTGFLVFEIKSYLSGPVQKKWIENQSVRLEEELELVVPNLFAALQLVRESRILKEEQSIRYRQREAEAAAVHHRLVEDQKRWEALVQIAQKWKDQELVLEFLRSQMTKPDGITALTGVMTESEWIDWVQRRLGQPLIDT